jgi:hypothetical protein
MKNRHSANESNTCVRQVGKVTNKTIATTYNDDEDFFFNAERKSSIIKLKMPPVEVKEIYDIHFWNKEFYLNYGQHTAVNNSNSATRNSSNLDSVGSMTSSTSSQSSSGNSSGNYSIASYLSVSPLSNGAYLSDLNHAAHSHVDSFNGLYTQQMVKSNSSTSTTPRSSISKSYRSNSESGSLAPFSDGEDSDEPYTFKEFVSTIISCDDKDMHRMLIQDIARTLELKFKEFKSAAALSASHNKPAKPHTGFYLNSDADMFTKIAERVFELGSEEPNGILGARLQLKLRLGDGQVCDCSELFEYDASTMSTSDIIVVINEDVSSCGRKLVSKFKMFSSFEKYLAIQIDPVAFTVAKNRLY